MKGQRNKLDRNKRTSGDNLLRSDEPVRAWTSCPRNSTSMSPLLQDNNSRIDKSLNSTMHPKENNNDNRLVENTRIGSGITNANSPFRGLANASTQSSSSKTMSQIARWYDLPLTKGFGIGGDENRTFPTSNLRNSQSSSTSNALLNGKESRRDYLNNNEADRMDASFCDSLSSDTTIRTNSTKSPVFQRPFSRSRGRITHDRLRGTVGKFDQHTSKSNDLPSMISFNSLPLGSMTSTSVSISSNANDFSQSVPTFKNSWKETDQQPRTRIGERSSKIQSIKNKLRKLEEVNSILKTSRTSDDYTTTSSTSSRNVSRSVEMLRSIRSSIPSSIERRKVEGSNASTRAMSQHSLDNKSVEGEAIIQKVRLDDREPGAAQQSIRGNNKDGIDPCDKTDKNNKKPNSNSFSKYFINNLTNLIAPIVVARVESIVLGSRVTNYRAIYGKIKDQTKTTLNVCLNNLDSDLTEESLDRLFNPIDWGDRGPTQTDLVGGLDLTRNGYEVKVRKGIGGSDDEDDDINNKLSKKSVNSKFWKGVFVGAVAAVSSVVGVSALLSFVMGRKRDVVGKG